MATQTSAPRSIRLNAADNVVVAIDQIESGATSSGIVARARVPKGHKLATAPIRQGEPVRKFGQIIGFAKSAIAPGDWIHEHNCGMGELSHDYAHAVDAKKTIILPLEQRATFEGYRRANGKVGTRNYVGVLTSVNCSTTVAGFIVKEIERSGVLTAALLT